MTMASEHEHDGVPDSESAAIGASIAATASTVAAPGDLRARIAADAERARRRPPRRRALTLAGAGAAVVLVALVTLLTTSDEQAPPTVAATARAALRAPNLPPPSVASDDERFVRARVGAVRFPNYGYESGWRVAGGRRAELGGRATTTVVYSGWGHRIGYTVVDGTPLAWPRARAVQRGDRRYAVLRRDGATIVTWRQGGHTCVLASRSAPLRAMLALATWS